MPGEGIALAVRLGFEVRAGFAKVHGVVGLHGVTSFYFPLMTATINAKMEIPAMRQTNGNTTASVSPIFHSGRVNFFFVSIFPLIGCDSPDVWISLRSMMSLSGAESLAA